MRSYENEPIVVQREVKAQGVTARPVQLGVAEQFAGVAQLQSDDRRALRQPRALPVPTFEGGTIAFIISQNRQRTGYEITTLFPQPPSHDLPGR